MQILKRGKVSFCTKVEKMYGFKVKNDVQMAFGRNGQNRKAKLNGGEWKKEKPPGRSVPSGI